MSRSLARYIGQNQAVLHQYAMQYTQIQLDPMQLLAAVRSAQQEQDRLNGIVGLGIDPRRLRVS